MPGTNDFPSWWNNDSILIVIDIGIDESERPPSDLIVSAVIGHTALMRKFKNKWNADLERYRVEFFHAKDYYSPGAKPYRGLSTTKRKMLLRRLATHMDRYVDAGISVAINREEYKAITSERFRSNWGSAYTLAIQLLLMVVHSELHRSGHAQESVNILIEQGQHVYQALQMIEIAKTNEFAFLRIATVGTGGKKDNSILQAADWVSHGWSQYLHDGHSPLLNAVAGSRPEKFPLVGWNPGLIERLKSDIDADIERRRVLNLKPLRRGQKLLLKHPMWDDLRHS
jgi:hypothetical protein